MKIDINILNENIKISNDIIDAADGDELVARIFYNRGYKDPDTIRQMLHEELYIPTSSSEFPCMSDAVMRIAEAIECGEKIAVYGDYDVDGVTSTALLVQCLKWFTDNVIFHVPDRFAEGYGINEGVIHALAGQGVVLVITCDCGISNVNEIRIAKELGMDVIVTDHHNVPDELPCADVILNPKLLNEGHRARNISGCGMAYFLCLALLEHYNQPERAEVFLDLLAMSLIADVVSLNGENRYLLKKALPRLFNTERIGLKKLFSIIEKNSALQSEEDVAFQIAPRINAAGRMESARMPVELLLTDDICLAEDLAHKIDFLNAERKRIQQEIIEQALEMVESRKKNKTVLVLFGEHWHHGIIGIAAGKICEAFRKPAILLSMKEDGSTVVGSARSTEEINIYELIKACSGKLLKFGGHSQAAGLSLKKEDVEDFTREIEQLAESKYFIEDRVQIDVDMELSLGKINQDIYERILRAGPYGEGFEAPVFLARSVTVASDRKTQKNHHIMVLGGKDDARIPAVKWFGADEDLQGRLYDVAYKIGINTYKGNTQLQLTIDRMMETEGEPEKAFDGIFVDERGTSLDVLVQKYPGGLFFYEGLKNCEPSVPTVDRHGIHRNDTLVFLSTPVNTQIFREAISLAKPRQVVISFSGQPDYSFKGFMANLMGMVKYIVNRQGGRSSLDQLALRLCIEENILKAALKYLKTIAPIEFLENADDDEIFIYTVKKPQGKDSYMLEKNLKNALMEKNAYKQFIMKLNADMFREYLK